MTQISIVGNILGSSGYDIHTRELTKALGKIADVKLIAQIQAGQENLLTDKEVEILKAKDKEEVRLIITNPLHWRINLCKGRNWAYLIWEGDKVPRHYLDECMNPDIEYVIVPSEHTKRAIINTCNNEFVDGTYSKRKNNEQLEGANIEDKIKIIPHGVDLSLFYPKNKDL